MPPVELIVAGRSFANGEKATTTELTSTNFSVSTSVSNVVRAVAETIEIGVAAGAAVQAVPSAASIVKTSVAPRMCNK